jgi:hypothetical protein
MERRLDDFVSLLGMAKLGDVNEPPGPAVRGVVLRGMGVFRLGTEPDIKMGAGDSTANGEAGLCGCADGGEGVDRVDASSDSVASRGGEFGILWSAVFLRLADGEGDGTRPIGLVAPIVRSTLSSRGR